MSGKIPVLFFFLLLFSFFSMEVEAQRMMILQKGANQKSRIKFEEGDELVYQEKGRDFFVSDRIKEIHRDFLVLTENIIRPDNIAAIDVRNKDERNRTLSNLSGLMMAGGVLYLTAETINGLYHEGKLTYSRGGLVTVSALIASGFILSKFRYKYFKNKGRKKIQIIYLDDE